MSTFIDRIVSSDECLGSPNWQKPKHILEAIAELKKRRGDQKEQRSDDCGRQDGGKFGPNNDCAKGDSGPVESEVKASKKRNVDVMLGGGRRVAVMDSEARDRAIADFKSHPKPEGSSAGSATDVWGRTFVSRPKGSNKISESDPVFPKESLRQNGQYVAHEAVGQYLSMRHETERAAAGGSGPGSIIDLNDPDVDDKQIDYVADALAEDAVHAYEVLQVDPGFYSTDLKKTMDAMSTRHPELEKDENSKFIFTSLLAITSSGQGPDANLADADGLYRMWKEHGTVVPSVYGGGSRDVTTSLRNLQSLLDSFGVDRTRRLLSGYAPASRVAKTFRTLAEKSGDPGWRERTGSSELNLPKPLQATGELKDEVIPVFSVFGPKIGSFYANLTGRHDFLTMDRWLMRSVGRVTGDLVTRSTPEQAKARARSILDIIESGKWKKSYLFGTDSSHGVTKELLVRSLKIQEKTGVIEENGASFVWATAAERSHQKTKRPTGGGYGRHEDDTVHSLHQAGNSLFKSLVHEQQDPRTGTARSNIREVFRRIQDKFEQKSGRKPDVDEIQAALWQYEKRLWKHLGAKTNIEDNSLFSSAADGILSGKIPQRKYSPSDKRSVSRGDDSDVAFDTHHFDAEQSIWVSDFIDSGVDIVSLISELEKASEESRNFDALDYGRPVRSAISSFMSGVFSGAAAAFGVPETREDCGRQQGGQFGPGNDCAKADSGGQDEKQSSIETQSSTKITSGKQWRRADGITVYKGRQIPSKSLSKSKSVAIVHGKLLAKSLNEIGVSLDEAARVCSPDVPGAEVSIVHGTLEDAAKFIQSPEDHPEIQTAVTFFSKLDVAGVAGGVAVGTTLMEDDEEEGGGLLLQYGMFSVSEEARESSSIGIARALMKDVTRGITEAEKLGVKEVLMFAAGSAKEEDDFRGYRIWPRLGFDGEIPRELITPKWNIKTGLFNAYGSRIPDKILSPRAMKEKKSGSLTIQALYETKEGQDWWESNGGAMPMALAVGDKKSLGWSRFQKVRDRHSARDMSDAEFLDAIDLEWRNIRAECESRAFCPTGEGGGVDNSCGSSSGSSAGQSLAETSRITSNALEDATSENGSSSDDIAESLSLVGTSRRFELVGSIRKNLPSDPDEAGDFVAKTLIDAQAKGRPLPGKFVDLVADKVRQSLDAHLGTDREDGSRVNASCFVSTIVAAAVEYPDIADSPVTVGNVDDVFSAVLSDGVSDTFAAARAARDAAAFYSVITDEIMINSDAGISYMETVMGAAQSNKSGRFYSTSRLSHVIAHEDAHRHHFRAMRERLGIEIGKKISKTDAEAILAETNRHRQDLLDYATNAPDGMSMIRKMRKVSGYAKSDVIEFVAEYYTSLALKETKRDKQLDKAMELLGFPSGKLPEGKKQTRKKTS